MWDYEKKIQMWYRFGVRVYYTKTQKYITEEMIRKEDTEECEIWKKHGQKEIKLGKICVHCSFMISWIFYGMFSRKYEWMFIQKKDGRMICIHVSCTRTSNYSGKYYRNYSRKYEEKNEREISRRREILMDDMYSGVLEPGPDSCWSGSAVSAGNNLSISFYRCHLWWW